MEVCLPGQEGNDCESIGDLVPSVIDATKIIATLKQKISGAGDKGGGQK
jgi:hypothetical protein